MKDRFFPYIIALSFLYLLMMPTAYAAETRVPTSMPYLSIYKTTATCSVTCQPDSADDEVCATLVLYDGITPIKSWSGSGKGIISLSGECRVSSGKTYRLELTWSINGIRQPSTSVTKTCY